MHMQRGHICQELHYPACLILHWKRGCQLKQHDWTEVPTSYPTPERLTVAHIPGTMKWTMTS